METYYPSVLQRCNYGKITLNFKQIMDAQNISRNKLASLAGIRFEVANRLYKGETQKLDLDVLARVCYVLNCEVQDVLYFDKKLSNPGN